MNMDKVSLVQTLEKRGLLDITKAYLRSNIYENLKTNNTTQFNSTSLNSPYQSKAFSDNLAIKLSISLVIDFLRKLNLSYTLNVFNNESKSLLNTYPYTESEILSIMNIKVSNLNSNANELFNSFLCYLAKEKMTPRHCTNSESQTDYRMTETSASTQIPIDELLRNVEMKYSSKINMDSLLPSKSFEERMTKYKTELDLRYKIELDSAIKRFQEIEASQIRIEENKKYSKKIEAIKDNYEKEYKTKFDSLTQRENDFKIRMAQKETDYEALLHHNRQKFQEQLEVVKIKEEEMNRKIDNEMNKLHLDESKLLFQLKENEYIKNTASSKIKEQIELFKSEYDKQLENDKKEIERKSNEVTKRELLQNTFQEKYDSCIRERNELSDTVKQLRNDLKLATVSQDRIAKDNEALREQIRSMTLHEKRNSEIIAKNDIEIHLLKDEIQLLKKSLDSHKSYSDDRKNEIFNELNRKVKEINEVHGISKGEIDKEQNEMYKSKIKSLEETCTKYKEMCNTLMQKSSTINTQSLNRNPMIIEMGNTTPLHQIANKTFGNTYKGSRIYSDRRKVLAQLEDEQLSLNKEIKSSFRNLTRKEAPVISFTEEQLKQIKRDNYLKSVIENEKEKVVQMIYNQSELNDNEKREVIEANSELINTFSNSLKNQLKKETIKIGSNNSPKPEIIKKIQSGNEQNKKLNIFNEEEKKQNSQQDIKTNNQYKPNEHLGDKCNNSNKDNDSLSNNYIRNTNTKPQFNITNDNSINQSKLQTTITEIKQNENYTSYDKHNKKQGTISKDISGSNRINSNRNQSNDNEISVENITSDSKEFNSERKQPQLPKTQEKNNLSIINNSIKEEIDDTQSNNISNLIDKRIKNDSSDHKGSTINKFQNIDYDSKKEDPSGIEEYGDDFIEDIDGLDKKVQSLDLEAIKQASIGQLSAKGKHSNPSSSINKSSGSYINDKNPHPSNIEENIEEEISYENSLSKKEKSNKTGNDDSGSNKYNDFVSSNANISSKKDATLGKEYISGEIKEEINPNEDEDDGYDPYN